MLAVRGICENGQIRLLEAVPRTLRSQVAVVFLDVGVQEVKEVAEAATLAQSPTFRRLIQRGLAEVEQGKTRSAKDFLDELPD